MQAAKYPSTHLGIWGLGYVAAFFPLSISFLGYRFIEIQNGAADHCPRGHLVQVYLGRNVFDVRHSDSEGRGTAVFKVPILFLPETEKRCAFARGCRATGATAE